MAFTLLVLSLASFSLSQAQFPGGQFGGGQFGGQTGGQFGGQFGGQQPGGFGGQFGGQQPGGFGGQFGGQQPGGFGGQFGGQQPGGFPGQFGNQFGNPFGQPGSGFGFPGFNDLQNIAGVGPQGGQIPQPPALATCRMQNQAGDVLQLTLRESQNPFSSFAGPFAQLFNQQNRNVRAVGTLIKTGATSGAALGTTSGTGSLNGIFKIVATVNGNTAAQCIGMGPPIGVPASTQPTTAASPFGSSLNPFASNPFSNLAQFNSPTSTVPLVMDTDLRADTVSSTVQGFFHGVTLNELVGRGLHVCADANCAKKTDMCCASVRDSQTVEEFEKFLQQQALLSTAAGLQAGGTGGHPPAPTPAAGGGGAPF